MKIRIEMTGKAEGLEDHAVSIDVDTADGDFDKHVMTLGRTVMVSVEMARAEKMESTAEGDLGPLSDEAIETAGLNGEVALIVPMQLSFHAANAISVMPVNTDHYLTDPGKWFLVSDDKVLCGKAEEKGN